MPHFFRVNILALQYTFFFVKCRRYNSHTDIVREKVEGCSQILTSFVTLTVPSDDSCSAEVGGGRSAPSVEFITSTVGGGNVADCPDEVG